MRRALVAVIVAGCGSHDAMLLTLSSPADLPSDFQIEIFLATADAPSLVSQRATTTTVESVAYYRERAPVDPIVVQGDQIDGYTIRLEAGGDQNYVPFVVAATTATPPQMLAIGVYHDTDDPTPLPITSDRTNAYTIALQPVAPATAAITAGEVLDVWASSQNDSTPWHSGFAWRPLAGPELRVLLPDLGADPHATDASTRTLDLDYDGHVASAQDDCDDTNAAIHPGVTETCGGGDTACNGMTALTSPCTPTSGGCMTGQQVCEDTSTEVTSCSPDPVACGCMGNACETCSIAFPKLVAAIAPCQPSVGTFALPSDACANGCVVSVVSAPASWDASVGADPLTFGTNATTTSATIFLKVGLTAGTVNVGTSAGEAIGKVILLARASGAPTPTEFVVELELDQAPQQDGVCPLPDPTTSGMYVPMTCSGG